MVDPQQWLTQWLMALWSHVWQDGQGGLAQLSDHYLLQTVDFDGHGAARPLMSNEVLVSLHHMAAQMCDALLVAVVTYAFLRSMFERSFRARYTLQAIMPHLLVVTVLANFGLLFLQGAVDVNNAIVHTFWTTPMAGAGPGPHGATAWQVFLYTAPEGNLLLSLMLALTAIMLLLLAVVAVARNVMLILLAAASPLAFACLLLPETRSYASAWTRLFLSAVFSQAAQVFVLRAAMLLMLGSSFLSAVHGLVALYLALRVPGALHAASKAESKLLSIAKHAEHAAQHAMTHTPHPRAHASAAR